MPTTETIGEARLRLSRLLVDCSESPQLDVDLLLGYLLQRTKIELLTGSSDQLSDNDSSKMDGLIARRCAGEPVAYITGQKMFRNIDLVVDKRVLVPRPETEQLVEIALRRIWSSEKHLRVIDVGTGSGSVALALADETRNFSERMDIFASDISAEALEVAALNCRKLGLEERVNFVQSSLLSDVDGQFDVVLANLPYLRPDQAHWSTRAEPALALFGGADGFDLYRRLLPQLPDRIKPGGLFVAEIDPSQAHSGIHELKRESGFIVRVEEDLSGRSRFLIGEFTN